MMHAQPEDQAGAVLVFFRQLLVPNQIPDGIPTSFYGNHQGVRNGIGAEEPVARCRKHCRIHIHGPKLRTNAATEKVIETTVLLVQIIVHIDVVFADEARNDGTGNGGIHEAAHEAG